MNLCARVVFILLISSTLLTSFVHAKVRKCVLSNGHVVYTDIGCPEQTAPKKKSPAEKSKDPYADMSDIERTVAMAKRNSNWEKASKQACLKDIEEYAKTLQPDFSELIVKKQHKLVTRSHNQEDTEYVHRVSFFFMANNQEWESSGNCHAKKQANVWETNYRRITTGIPYISARKPELQSAHLNESAEKSQSDKKEANK